MESDNTAFIGLNKGLLTFRGYTNLTKYVITQRVGNQYRVIGRRYWQGHQESSVL